MKYDKEYGKGRFATLQHMSLEHDLITNMVKELPKRKVLLDLGCATGRETFEHWQNFGTVIGFDISPSMIRVAQRKTTEIHTGDHRLLFDVHDIETTFPIKDESVSFVYMNNGTASDVRDIKTVLSETARVLERGGSFLFSFYNSEALCQRLFLPWPLSLTAGINPDLKCLDVLHEGQPLPIYANPYSIEEVRGLISSPLSISNVCTHPSVSAIMPNELFEDSTTRLDDINSEVARMDHLLMNGGDEHGAYIIITGKKV